MNRHINFELSGAEYDRFNRAWTETIVSALLRSLPQGSRVLDAGCGRGELVQLLTSEGFACTAIDQDEQATQRASQWCETATISIEDARQVFDDHSFDAVVLSHVLEHTNDPGAALANAAALSRGLVILAVPNLAGSQVIADAVRNRVRTINTGHRQGWDRSHLETLITTTTDLSVVEVIPDRVIVPSIVGLAFVRLGWADAVEQRLLTRLLPGLANSLIVVCERR